MIETTGNPYELKAEQIKVTKGKAAEHKKWVVGLCLKIRDERDRRDEQRREQWETSVAQYQGRMVREDAGPQDCQLDFTQSRELEGSMGPRMINPIMGYSRMFVCEEIAPGFKETAREQELVSAHIAPKQVYLEPMYMGWQQASVFGTLWIKMVWSQRHKTVREWAPGKDGKPKITTREVLVREGAFPKVVKTVNMLWPSDCDDIDTAPWIAERFYERPSEIEEKSKREVNYRKGLKAKKLEDLSDGRPDPKTTLSNEREKGAPPAPNDDAPRELYQVCVPHPDDGYETFMWVDIDNEIVLGWVGNWFFDFQRPYRRWAFRPILDSLDGESLMQMIEHLHKAYTAVLQIILDNSARSTEKLLLFLKNTGLREVFADGKLRTGAVEVDSDVIDDLKKSLLPISLQSELGNLKWVLELMLTHMNNVSSIAAALFGQEVAQRPTATGTDRVLSESKQPLSLMLERWLQFWADVHTMQYARYRQFKPEYMPVVAEEVDGNARNLTAKKVSWPAGYWGETIGFKTKVSSQTMRRAHPPTRPESRRGAPP